MRGGVPSPTRRIARGPLSLFAVSDGPLPNALRSVASEHPPLLDLSVRTFLDALRSPAPTPAGGAAAALAGALGAALVEMTASLTIGRRQFRAVDAEARRITREADGLQLQFQRLFVAESETFARLGRAYHRRARTAADRLARLAAIQEALADATAGPRELVHGCTALLRLCEEAVPVLNPGVLADVLLAARLAHCGLEGAAASAEASQAALADQRPAAALGAELSQARRDAAASLAGVLEAGTARARGRLA